MTKDDQLAVGLHSRSGIDHASVPCSGDDVACFTKYVDSVVVAHAVWKDDGPDKWPNPLCVIDPGRDDCIHSLFDILHLPQRIR